MRPAAFASRDDQNEGGGKRVAHTAQVDPYLLVVVTFGLAYSDGCAHVVGMVRSATRSAFSKAPEVRAAVTREMKRTLLAVGIFTLVPTAALPAENMLQWCASAYPKRLEWCKSQYPGTLDPISNSPAAQATPVQPIAPALSAYDALLPNIFGRPSSPLTTFKIGTDGRFAAEAIQVVAATRSALRYAKLDNIDIEGEDDHCLDQDPDGDRPKRVVCYADFGLGSLTVDQPDGGKTTDRVEISFLIEKSDNRPAHLFQFAVIVDAISRVLDPNLTDDQRTAMFAKLSDGYFASGRVEGTGRGVQTKYQLTEEDGYLKVVVVPDGPTSASGNLPSAQGNPIIALVRPLDRDDLVKPDPLDAPEVQQVIAHRRWLARILLEQLDKFRYEKRFHAVGFMESQPYNGWLKSLYTISKIDNDIIRQAGVRSGAYNAADGLYNMAWEYMHNDGRDTAESISSRKDVMKFLNGS